VPIASDIKQGNKVDVLKDIFGTEALNAVKQNSPGSFEAGLNEISQRRLETPEFKVPNRNIAQEPSRPPRVLETPSNPVRTANEEPQPKGFDFQSLMKTLVSIFPTRPEVDVNKQGVPMELRHLDNSPGNGGDVLRRGKVSTTGIGTAYWGKAVTAVKDSLGRMLTGVVNIVGSGSVSVTADAAAKTLTIGYTQPYIPPFVSVNGLTGAVGIHTTDTIEVQTVGQELVLANRGVTSLKDKKGALKIEGGECDGMEVAVTTEGEDTIRVKPVFINPVGGFTKYFINAADKVSLPAGTWGPAGDYLRIYGCLPEATTDDWVTTAVVGPFGGGAEGGVQSLNGKVGDLFILPGTGVTIGLTENGIVINATGTTGYENDTFSIHDIMFNASTGNWQVKKMRKTYEHGVLKTTRYLRADGINWMEGEANAQWVNMTGGIGGACE